MKKNFLKNVPPEKVAELERLRVNVAHAEAHDQHDTCHHDMLRRLEVELGLITSGKIEGPTEVTEDG